MRFVTILAAALMLICFGVLPGHAEKRVALVVGNDRYLNLPADQQLQKAVNDAHAVGDALGRLDFEVIRGENLGRQALVDKFDEMTRRLSPGDVAFFFFAGHGVTLGGGNYILPADVPNVEAGQESRLARAALGENDLVSDLQQRGVRVAVVVLDACRENPFQRPGVRAIGGERGLARIEPVRGVFTFYSAGIGQTALDRLGNADPDPNSVFTRVLLPKLTMPGVDLTELAVEVREEVARLAGTVGHDQRPAYYDETIGGRVYLAGLPPVTEPTRPAPVVPSIVSPTPDPAAQAWAAIKDTTNVAALDDFIRQFGSTRYGYMATSRREELNRKVVAIAPASPGAGTDRPTPSLGTTGRVSFDGEMTTKITGFSEIRGNRATKNETKRSKYQNSSLRFDNGKVFMETASGDSGDMECFLNRENIKRLPDISGQHVEQRCSYTMHDSEYSVENTVTLSSDDLNGARSLIENRAVTKISLSGGNCKILDVIADVENNLVSREYAKTQAHLKSHGSFSPGSCHIVNG